MQNLSQLVNSINIYEISLNNCKFLVIHALRTPRREVTKTAEPSAALTFLLRLQNVDHNLHLFGSKLKLLVKSCLASGRAIKFIVLQMYKNERH